MSARSPRRRTSPATRPVQLPPSARHPQRPRRRAWRRGRRSWWQGSSTGSRVGRTGPAGHPGRRSGSSRRCASSSARACSGGGGGAPPGGPAAPPCTVIGKLYADAAYDSTGNRGLCLRDGIESRIREVGAPHGSGLRAVRCVVEHDCAWLLTNKRLDRRQDRLVRIILALLTASCVFILAIRISTS